MKQTGGEAAEPPHRARLGHWRNTWGESHKILVKAGSSRGRAGSVHSQKKGECSYKKQTDLDFEKYRGRGKKESLMLQAHLLAPADMRKTCDFAAKSSILCLSNLLCLQMNQFDFMNDRL